MSAIKDGRYPVLLDKERHLLISLNVLDEIQDKFGSYTDLDQQLQGKGAIKNLKWLLTLAINEGKAEGEKDVTETEVGRMIHSGNMAEATASIYKAFGLAIAGKEGSTEENDGPEEPADDFHPADKESE